jgi:hypothetical protein
VVDDEFDRTSMSLFLAVRRAAAGSAKVMSHVTSRHDVMLRHCPVR